MQCCWLQLCKNVPLQDSWKYLPCGVSHLLWVSRSVMDGDFFPPFATMGLFQEIWSPNLRLQNWYRLGITKNFRCVPKLDFWVLKVICNRHEGDVCMGRCYYESAVELLLWLSGPRYEGQELCDHASHTGSPCQAPAHLAGCLSFSVSREGNTVPQCLESLSQPGSGVVQRPAASWSLCKRAELLHGPWCLWPCTKGPDKPQSPCWRRVQRSKWSSSVEGDIFYSE